MAATSNLLHPFAAVASWPGNHTAWAVCFVTSIVTLAAAFMTQTVHAPNVPAAPPQNIPTLNLTIATPIPQALVEKKRATTRTIKPPRQAPDTKSDPPTIQHFQSECNAETLRLRECQVEAPNLAQRKKQKGY